MEPAADPGGGQFGATVSPNGCALSYNYAPLIKLDPLLVPIESETKTKILSLS